MDTMLLLELCQKGELQAIEELVSTYGPPITRLAFSILEDPAEADEAAQEVFLIVLKTLNTYRAEAAFTTWLYAITVNVCRDSLRKRRTRERVAGALQALWFLGRESVDTPEDKAVEHETENTVRQAINALSEKHRIPIILFYYNDFSVREIADILDIYEGTVHSRLSIARNRLRTRLSRILVNPAGAGKDVER
jgi:RNA polymerase sigma-70 factor (ECF subfamily)